MEIGNLLRSAEEMGVYLYVEDNKLKFRSRLNGLPVALRKTLSERKTDIIDYLRDEESKAGLAHSALPGITPYKRETSEPLLLSRAQQRLWFLDQYMGPNAVYNTSLALHLRGEVDVAALRRSLLEIIARHEALRTRFEPYEGGAIQVIYPPALDLPIEPVADAATLHAIRQSEKKYLFNLSTDSLCRFRLLATAYDDSHVLSITLHHIISDGWSLGILLRELEILYRAFKQGRPSPLAPLPIQYADYAQWQRQCLKGDVLEGPLIYWRKQLRGLPPGLRLPTDRPRPKELTFRGDVRRIALSRSLSDRLKVFSREQEVTLFMTLLAGFSVLLSRHSGQTDIAVGTPIANRTRQETEGLIGFFANTLVIRSRLSEDPSFVDLLRQTKETTLQGYDHQDIPFEQLVEELNPQRSLDRSPLFQVMFALQNVAVESAALDDLEVTVLNLESEHDDQDGEAGVSHFDMTLNLRTTEEGVRGGMEYNTDLFDRDTIERLLRHYEQLLEALLIAPDKKVSTVEFLLDEKERLQLRRQSDQSREHERRMSALEALLSQHPLVKTAVVTRSYESPETEDVAVYVVPELDSEGQAAAADLAASLKTYVRTQPTLYLLPKSIVILDELPLDDSGQLDHEALPATEDRRALQKTYEAPRDEVETALCRIWQELLGVERVGIRDNFFVLGGHSLLGTRLISDIRHSLGAELPLRAIFEYPTIAELSESLRTATLDHILPPVLLADRTQNLPLSYAQQRLWFIDRLGEGSVEYNVPGYFVLQGQFDVPAFKLALRDLLDRHEVLRTHFKPKEGTVEQVLEQEYLLPLRVTDLSELQDKEKGAAAERLLREEIKTPFDLSRDLMLRIHAVTLNPATHLILYNMHHIASDGWSLAILKRELGSLYEAHRKGEGNPLPPLAVQYLDYAVWQRRWLQGARLAQQLDYWKEQLAGIPPVHSLPLDKPRPAQQSFEGRAFRQSLGRDMRRQIKTLCERHGITPFMFLETAFAVLLGRYSNEQDIVVGTAIAGRTHKDVEKLIGFFINSLVLRTDLSAAPTFSELLKRNKQMILDAYAHQHVPFEMLVEELRPERNMSYNSLFQILFVVQNNETDTQELAIEDLLDLDERQTRLFKVSIRFDLALHVVERDDALVIRWSFRDSLFQHDTVARMAANYEVLLEKIIPGLSELANEPQLKDIDLISASERQKLLFDWSGHKVSYPQGHCIHQLFEEQVERTPDSVAAISGDEQLTYRELNQRANRLAHHLIAKGVLPDTIVALSVERSLAAMVGLLGILKSGAGYLPLDPEYPRGRLQYMLEDSGARLVLAQSHRSEVFAGANCEIICMDDKDVQATLAGRPDYNPDLSAPRLTPQHLAYVIYTSGSTGRPKGVAVNHGSVCNFLFCARDLFLADHIVGSIVSSPLAFDATVQSLYVPLIAGKYVELVPEDDLLLTNLADYLIDDEDALLFKITPSHLKALANKLYRGANPRARHVVVVAGEQLDRETLRPWCERLPGAKFINEYGPTETTVGACTFAVTDGLDFSTGGRGVPIGKPLANVQFYVLNSDRRLQPIGVAGELYIGGAGLAREYLHQPELTAARFVAHPFSENPDDRVYKTGDLVRWLADGNIEFLGRADGQVKLRGFRIELGEIEAVLTARPSLHSAVVTINSDDEGDRQLIAYVCPSAEYLDKTAQRFNADHLQQWTAINDNKYEGARDSDVPLAENFAGWNSSYTDEPVAADEMHEWLSGAVSRIEALRPTHLLEMGCGGGLLLFRYGEMSKSVRAMDISAIVLESVQRELDRRNWSHVQLQQGDALSTDRLAGQRFDTIVINSVAQYFPNQLYLDQVIENFLPLLDAGGHILIGDVRNLDLLHAHAAAVERYHLKQSTSAGIVAGRVQRRIQQEPELLISPSYFARLTQRFADIDRVDIQLKRGLGHNEMLRYRYDVVIRKKKLESIGTEQRPLSWHGYESMARSRQWVEQSNESFGLSGVPNARISEDVAFSSALSEWAAARPVSPVERAGVLSSAARGDIESLESLLQFAERSGYQCGVTWSQHRLDHLDIIFCRRNDVAIQARHPYLQNYQVSYPQLASVGHELSRELKQELQESLPEHMIPSVFIAMEQLPLTPSGKIDRKALPRPQEGDLAKEDYVAPGNPIEEQLCHIWQELLKVKQVGITDDFFASGGHSLLAVRLVTEIEKRFGKSISLKKLFETPTVAGIAQYLAAEDALDAKELPLVVADPGTWHQPFSLTGVQQAYLLGRSSAFELGNIATHSYAETTITELDLVRFSKAWNSLIQRHGMLRAVFDSQSMTQRIRSDVPEYEIAYLDLADETPPRREQQLLAIRNAMSHQVLASDRWPLFDIRVTRISERDYRLHYSRDALISDAASQRILIGELFALYQNPDLVLPALKISFRDYVLAEESIKSSALYESARSYWLDRLDAFPAAPQLPLRKQPREIGQPQFISRQFILDHSAWDAFQEKSRSLGVTPTALVMSLFAQILNRWSGQSSFSLNVTLFNRLPIHEQVNALVGDFTSLTLLALELKPAETLAAVARHVQEQLWKDLENRYFGGTEVLRALNARAGSPQAVSMPIVFTSTLGLESHRHVDAHLSADGMDGKGNAGRDGFSVSQTPQVWLDHGVLVSPKGLTLKWMVLEELFPPGLIDDMFAGYRALLEYVSRPSSSLDVRYLDFLQTSSELSVVPESDPLPTLAVESEARSTLLHDGFRLKARTQGQRLALVSGLTRLSYRELDQLAVALASRLKALHAQPNELIAVVMEKGWEQVVGVLGILYAGAAYMPIDANSPDERIARLVAEGKARTVITQSHLSDRLSYLEGVEMLSVDASLLTQSSEGDELDERAGQADTDLAYVIFTSGSTGTPKGVMIDHRGAVNTVLDINERFAIGEDDKVLAVSSLNFDLSVHDIFGVLAAGGTVVMPQSSREKDVQHWCDLVEQEGVTFWNSVPALAQLYVEQVETLRSPGESHTLRLFMLSGDWIGLELPDRIKHQFPGVEVISLGGATEASIWSIYHPIDVVDSQWKSIPYGRPLKNQSVYILAEDLSIKPTWAVGGIYIGGIGVAKGYWNDLEKTNRSFISHPVSGARLYKTGDLGRYWPDGNIEFLGRNDNQVKIHGHRIELGEVESVLSEHPDVSESIVMVSGQGQNRYLDAYVLPEDGAGALRNSAEHVAFKLEQRGLLRTDGLGYTAIPLPDRSPMPLVFNRTTGSKEHLASNSAADSEPISLEDFGGWLSCLRQLHIHKDTHPLPKRFYPSGGSLYPVQVYLQLNSGVVAGLEPGHYYYDPSGHRLFLLRSSAGEGAVSGGDFCLYFIAQEAAMSPLYGDATEKFCLLEMGHMSYLLESTSQIHSVQMQPAVVRDEWEFETGLVLEASQKVIGCHPCSRSPASTKAPQYELLELERQSYRSFLDAAVTAQDLEQMLGELETQDFQIWVQVKQAGSLAEAGSFYLFDGRAQRLVAANDSQPSCAALHAGANENIYQGASFALYAVANERTEQLLMEAGYWGQGLMSVCTKHDLGMCPLGNMGFSPLRERLKLNAKAQLLYCFLGGRISREQMQSWPVEDRPVRAKAALPADEALKSYLSARLPYYMVPRRFKIVENWPLTSNGKVDRKALCDLDRDGLEDDAILPPEGATEQLLSVLWSSVLKRQHVGRNENFFLLGGHSLLATQLASRIRQAFAVELPIRSYFELQTVQEQAQAIDRARQNNLGNQSDDLVPLERVSRDQPLSLSYSQQRLWFLSQYLGANAVYNIPLALRLRGRLDVEALCASLNELIERHEALRTRFEVRDGHPVQVFDSSLPEITTEPVHSDEELQSICRLERQYRFDLSRDRLYRIRLLADETDDSHVLVVTIHHSVSDVWSQGIFFRELWNLYKAAIRGEPSPLKPLAIQYADYAQWQRTWLSGARLEDQLSYWRRQLSDLPPCLTLPTDRPRPVEQTYRGRKLPIHLSTSQSDRLARFSQEQGVTAFMTLLSIFAVLLSRYSTQTQIAIGTPIANRTRRETENLMGFFANTLVMRSDLDADPDFLTLLKQTREMALQSYSHQDIPFEQLVEEINPQRNTAHSPLFQVWFVLQNLPFDSVSLPDVEIYPITFDDDVSHFDLTLNLRETADGIKGTLEYNTDLFERSTAERMLVHYENLMSALLDAPDVPVSQVKFLTEIEKQHQLVTWNDTKTGGREDECVHELFEQQAEINPEKTAVIFDGAQVSYRQLNERANRLAHYLIEQGVEPDSLVGLCMEPSVEAVVAILGILKAGGAYVPLDPGNPARRLAHVLEDCGARWVITQAHLLDSVPVTHQHVLSLDSHEIQGRLAGIADISNTSRKNLSLRTSHLAYVIYTSGSTGAPKGVMLTHQNLINYLRHAASYLREQIIGSVVSTKLAFDATVCSLFVPLCAGKSIELLREDEAAMEKLNDCLSDDTDSLLFKLTPAHLQALLNSAEWQANKASQHVLVIGGEQLRATTVKQWEALLPASVFINEYGPTEAAVGCCTYETGFNDSRTHGDNIPIGEPIGNARLYALDSNFNLQPQGVSAELFIAGQGLARGYLGQAGLTAERFVPDPFAQRPGERLYRTGDLVRYLPSGSLEYLRRTDDQVKIRGFRIELGEIEAQLLQLDQVKGAVVLAREDSRHSELSLVAYIVAQPMGEDATDRVALIREIKASLRSRLPDYMVPESFLVVDRIPLTSNGKVDKKALPSAHEADLLKDPYVPPRNEIEEKLCRLWQQVLKREQVGIEDDFFDLGGHSLLAMRLISAMRLEFGVELPLRALFQFPTIARLSEKFRAEGEAFVLPPVRVADRQQFLPLSYSQQRLWFIDQLGEGSAHYNMVGAFVMPGQIDVDAFRAALKCLLERHEVLRTHFVVVDGKPGQIISPHYQLPLERHDLSSLTDAEKGREISKVAEQEANTAFNLQTDLLLRVHLLKLTETTHLVIYVTHHIASDGWSIAILKNEFQKLYDAFRAGDENPLAPLPVQYADYALWQRQWLQGEVLEKQLSYWKQRLAGIPPVHNLPLDRPRPALQSYQGQRHRHLIEASTTEKIHRLCREHQVTLFMFLQTAFATLLGRYSNETDVVLGSAVSGRVHKDVESLIGFFVNPLVLRTDLSGDPSFSELLKNNKQNILDAYAHQTIPFETLVEEIRPDRNLSYNPIFQIMFAAEREQQYEIDGHRAQELSAAEASALQRIQQSVHTATSTRFDLLVHVAEKADVLSVNWLYNESIFTAVTIERLGSCYAALLDSIVTELTASTLDPGRPEKALSELGMLDSAVRSRLLETTHGAQTDSLAARCLHRLFEEQVNRSPDHIAVALADHGITYSELNARANRLARYLIDQGTQPNSIVGLCVEHSIEMIVGLLGILKSGAAYLPMDPALPAARLDYMLDDAAVDIVLTQQHLLAEWSAGDRKALPIDGEMFGIMMRRFSSENLSHADDLSSGNRLAYVIYTSGSTGQAKGVMVSHQAVAAYCSYALSTYYEPDLVGSLVVTSFSVDMTVPSFYLPLLRGDRIQLLPTRAVLEELASFLLHTDENYLLRMTPSHANGLMNLLPRGESLANRHAFVLGGEALHGATVKRIAGWFPRAVVSNHYGPTEAVVGCVINPRIVDVDPSAGTLPIGRAMDNVQLYVLDARRQLQLPGAIGELAVGGTRLADGYLNDPKLTEERFISDPFSSDPSGRIYLTGDLVRWLPNQDLMFIGRADEQVKVRGFRIELGEVEAAIRRIPEIRDSAVLISSVKEGMESIVGYVVPREDITAEDDLELRQEKARRIKRYRGLLSQHLPNHMIPSVYVFMKTLPLTPSGKINRRALPAPQEADLHHESFVAPESEVEKVLCVLWQEILCLEQVGIRDNFFALGGHSLLATRLISAIREDFDIELPLRALFDFPTVTELAHIVEARLLSQRTEEEENEEFFL